MLKKYFLDENQPVTRVKPIRMNRWLEDEKIALDRMALPDIAQTVTG